MKEGYFYSPDDVKPYYYQIVPAYQKAFAGPPWFEVSKCADPALRCDGGYSSTELGKICGTCDRVPTLPAYEQNELVSRFEMLGSRQPTSWYLEQSDNGEVALASIAWSATADYIASERYSDVPKLEPWLKENLGNEKLIWLDEVFANKNVRSTGNLRNFGSMVLGFARRLDIPLIAYRTKTIQMTKAPMKAFADSASVKTREIEVPDRRDLVIIEVSEEMK